MTRACGFLVNKAHPSFFQQEQLHHPQHASGSKYLLESDGSKLRSFATTWHLKNL
jgi:hypothetical protein